MNSKLLQIENMDKLELGRFLEQKIEQGINKSKNAIVIETHKLPKKINREVFCAITGLSTKTFITHINLGYLKCTIRLSKTGRTLRDISKEDFISYFFNHYKNVR